MYQVFGCKYKQKLSLMFNSRRGYDDLGSHYLNMGDLNNALKNYGKVRDYCSSARHIVNMCLNVIKVCLFVDFCRNFFVFSTCLLLGLRLSWKLDSCSYLCE